MEGCVHVGDSRGRCSLTMGRKKGGRKRALDFVVSIDPSGEVNLCKQGVGPGAWGAGKIDDRALLSVAEELVKYENKERVRVLDLSQNKISRLPDKMQRLHKLEVWSCPSPGAPASPAPLGGCTSPPPSSA